MATLVISTQNSEELKTIKHFLKLLKVKNKEINLDKEEDLFLGNLIEKEKTGIKVSKESILNKLNNL